RLRRLAAERARGRGRASLSGGRRTRGARGRYRRRFAARGAREPRAHGRPTRPEQRPARHLDRLHGTGTRAVPWDRSAPRRRSPRRLALTPRAEVRRALTKHAAFDRRSALYARFALALVYPQRIAEVSRRAVAAHVIAQRGAADLDCIVQHRANGGDERFELVARNPPRGARRANARAEQRLVRVDIADADDDV